MSLISAIAFNSFDDSPKSFRHFYTLKKIFFSFFADFRQAAILGNFDDFVQAKIINCLQALG